MNRIVSTLLVVSLVFATATVSFALGRSPSSSSAAITPQTIYVNVASSTCLAAVRDLAQVATIENNLIKEFVANPVTAVTSAAATDFVAASKTVSSVAAEARLCLSQAQSGSGS